MSQHQLAMASAGASREEHLAGPAELIEFLVADATSGPEVGAGNPETSDTA